MSAAGEAFEALVVARDGDRARNLAAAVEDGSGASALTADGVEEARRRLAEFEVDAVVLDVPGDRPERAVDALANGRDERPLVALVDGHLDPTTALEAGATDVVAGPEDDPEVVANRTELAVEAAVAERAARESRRRYQELLDASQAAIVIYDDEGVLLYVNPALVDLVGADDPHDLVGRDVGSFVVDDADGDGPVVEQLLAEGAVTCEEVWIEGVDGEARCVDVAGSPVTVAGGPGKQAVLTDVTALKRRERRLRAERNRFNALFESVPEPAVHLRMDGTTPIVRNVNDAFAETFGYDVETLRGEDINDYIVPEGHEEEARRIDELTVEDEIIRRDVRREAADGVREFRFSARPLAAVDGTEESVSVYVDVTERKRRAEELRRQNERLDAFASIVSHDLRGPLTVAKGNVYLARDEDDPSYLESAEDALDRMERIIDDLLRLARSDEEGVDPEPTDPAAIVTEAWAAIDPADGAVENEIDAEILADTGQFRELVENLLRNALDHGGDDVTVTVGELTDGDDGETGFYVADDGPGIPEDKREAVFDPGFTTDDDGTGFGLVVVDEIARAHGWELSAVESADGGARFEFRGVERA